MGKLIIGGGNKLKGEIEVEGSKNAVLPILAASLLNSGMNRIHNCPNLKDVEFELEILKQIGCKITKEKNTIIIDSAQANNIKISENFANQMRSSIVFLGPMLARFGEVIISYPGGCEIGPRPIDLHLKALRSMGAKINDVNHGFIECKTSGLKGCDINLDYPSVGATENVLMAAVFAEGDTYIRNAAKEPEIVDLQKFLNNMGALVTGAGTSIIQIQGVEKKLKEVHHKVIPDRIVAGTYLVAAAITGGDILLKNVFPEHLNSVIFNLRDCGCKIIIKNNTIRVIGPIKPKELEIVRTLPYPGFPTDMQSQLMTLLTIAQGTSILVETIFESRYKHVDELLKMGANIKLEGRIAVIKGVKKLFGANVYAKDLRGGAALVLAGLVAEGETIVFGTQYIDRGYDSFEKKLSKIGAIIRREE